MNNPFNRYKAPFDLASKGAADIFRAVTPSSKREQEQRQAEGERVSTPVSLPKHLFTPEEGQSIDIRNLADIPAGPGSTYNMLTFTAPPGGITRFTSYAIFNDALDFTLVDFLPTINGSRILPFHGNPQANYKIALGLAPDLSNNSLIECQLALEPGQVLNWLVTNNALVVVTMGVRMKGYLDATQRRVMGRYGG